MQTKNQGVIPALVLKNPYYTSVRAWTSGGKKEGGAMSTFFAYYIGRYFSLWLTPENEKSFESPMQAKQLACSIPHMKKFQFTLELFHVRYSLYKIRTFFETNPDEEI